MTMISRLIIQEHYSIYSHLPLSIKHPMMLKQQLMGSVVCQGDMIRSSPVHGIDSIPFRILELHSTGATVEQGKITDSTEIILDPSIYRPRKTLKPKLQWASDMNDQVAGLDDQASIMLDSFSSWFNCIMLENPLLMPPLVSGLVLHGKSGVGKSLLAEAFARIFLIITCISTHFRNLGTVLQISKML